jgi:hypothetical protein
LFTISTRSDARSACAAAQRASRLEPGAPSSASATKRPPPASAPPWMSAPVALGRTRKSGHTVSPAATSSEVCGTFQMAVPT